MNEYEAIVKKIRKEVSKLTLKQQQEILKLYEDAIKNYLEKPAGPKQRV